MRVRNYDFIEDEARPEQTEVGGIHPFHELLYIASGAVAMRWMGSLYALKAPAVFLLGPNTPHGLTIVSARSAFGYLELDVQMGDFFPAIDKIMLWNKLQCQTDRDSPALRPIYRTIALLWDILNDSMYGKTAAKEIAVLDTRKILLLISGYLERETKLETTAAMTSEEQVHALMRYMESNYAGDISLRRLAGFVHLNTSYLIRLFHKVAGITPLGYLQELRMNAAVCFLETTSMPDQQIAEAVGYNSIHYFSRLFKMKYGVSPARWRQARKPADETGLRP